jgi:hypothetical protein
MRWVAALIVGWLVCLPAAGWARSTIEARVDRNTVGLEGNVRLQVEVQTDLRDGDRPGQLTAPPLGDWEVVTQMQQQSFINSASSQVLTLILRPTRPGKLTIGPFVLDADGKRLKTKPLPITVTGQAAPPAPAPPPTPGIVDLTGGDPGLSSRPQLDQAPDRQAFLVWDVDKQNVWLGEQVHARLSLYVNRGLAVVDPNLRSFSTEGFWSEPLPQTRPEAEQVVVGRDVFIRNTVSHYRLFPLRSGAVKLPAVHADLVLGDRSLFGGRRTKQPRDAAALTLDVRPLPTQGQPPGFAGPAVGRVTLQATVDRAQVRAENGVQLTITTTVDGLIGNVPEPKLEAPDWHVYPPTHDTQTQTRGRSVVGVRVSRMLLKPLKTGTLTIPALSLPYFDPGSGAYATATTQPQTVDVIGTVTDPAAASAPAGTATGPSSAPGSLSGASGDDAPTLRTIRTQSRLEPSSGPPWLHPLFPVAVIFPPLLWLGLLGLQRWRAHDAAGAEGRAVRRAGADARRAMEKLVEGQPPREAFAELSRLLIGFLETRLGLALRGTTTDVLRRRLLDADLPADLVAGITQELETCDFSRFSPGDLRLGELQEAVRRATELVARVDQRGGTP